MRALVLNHTFMQDIGALREAAGDSVDFRVLELDLLLTETLRVLPDDIGDGIQSYSRPEYEPHRRRLAEVLEGLFHDLYREQEFDLFVSPSDVFYYLRPALDVLHGLGVPYFVAERETTVAPYVMEENVALIKRWFPPIADHRTLCTRRFRDFWVGAGADPETITVTGQPRFDYYRKPELWPERLPYGDDGPIALFLSYNYSAYYLDGSAETDVWKEQHRETEEGLWELARRGWRILFKPHPHQERSDRGRLKAELGSLFGDRVHFISGGADVRQLIANSDVVIGYQSTALFEAMVARKPIVYAAWGEDKWRVPEMLLPFREWPEVLHVVHHRDDFVETVERALGEPWDDLKEKAARRPIEENIGVCDGKASERTIAEMHRVAAEFERGRTLEARQLRARLRRRPPPVRLRRRTVFGYKRLRRRAGALLGR